MKLGDIGSRVKECQQALKDTGYYDDVVDGIFGPKTKKATIEAQKDTGVEPTGNYDDAFKDLMDIKGSTGGLVDDFKDLSSIRTLNKDSIRRIAAVYNSTTDYIKKINNFKEDMDEINKDTDVKVPNKAEDGIVKKEDEVTDVPKEQEDTRSKESKGLAKLVIDAIPCYIINLNTGTQIEFYLTPDSINESKSNNYESQEIRGRSSPIQGYNNSGPREVSFSILLWQDYCPLGLLKTVTLIRALSYPHKDNIVMAPKCLLRIGSFINMTCIITNVSINWEKPYKEGIYSKASVDFAITEVEEQSKTCKEVEASV